MIKVGIVTMHYNPNYGGLLQAYALQEIIKDLGYESEFINYRQDINTFSKKAIRRLKDLYVFVFRPELYTARKQKYKFIKEKMNLGKVFYSYNKLCSEADEMYEVAICGSDQIWSNNQGKINPFHYLTFIDKRKRISYAPSIGYNRIQDNIKYEFKNHVNDIRFLSIREKKGAEIIKSITGRDAEVVLDPSFLLNKTEWLSKIKGKKQISPNENYILLYILGDNEKQVDYAKRLSKKMGYKLIAIETKNGKIGDLEIVYGSPFDFVELVNQACLVITDSFHGIAFSINLEKQFVAFKRFKDDDKISQNSRIYNILEKTNLMDRIITPDKPLCFAEDSTIDYDVVTPLIDAERKLSLNYLSKSIEAVIYDKELIKKHLGVKNDKY